MGILIMYPFLAAIIGAIFIAFGRRARRWGATAVGVTWLLYAAYETGMQQRWLCTGECNIRVDLLLIYPILLVASVGAGFGMARARRAPASKA
jgi:formate hydrogenlyase subunit 3/multisubunit Na+/H+ antiporter MnhD subunit